MNVLVGMIVYKRQETVNQWMRAWQNADKPYNAKLVVVHNHDGPLPNPVERDNICKWNPDWYLPRLNVGQDIAAFRDVVADSRFGDWDVLFWSTDDHIPLRKDIVEAFTRPFIDDPNTGLVGNYFAAARRGQPEHYRTSSFAISRRAATSLLYPPTLKQKRDCYMFEWMDSRNNMTAQIRRMGLATKLVTGVPGDPHYNKSYYMWDTHFLARENLWSVYEQQFSAESVSCSASSHNIENMIIP